MPEQEMNDMFTKSICRLPTCFRFRKYLIDFSQAHINIKANLIENIENINNEVNEIKNGSRNDVFNFTEEDISKLSVSIPKFYSDKLMDAVVMPEISRKDLRKAKRGIYKDNKDKLYANKDIPVDNEKFPIFNLLTKVQKSLNILNE